MQRSILALLRKRGSHGLTRLNAPQYMVLSLPARICELRKLGHLIETQRVRVGDALIARYILTNTKEIRARRDADGAT